MSDFALHPRLAADSFALGDWPLCRVLLANDGRFPWLILVPRRPEARELSDLAAADRAALMDEIVRAGDAMRRTLSPDKLNVAAIGNIVAQLHVHVVARFARDAAWPGTVWGFGAAVPYDAAARDAACAQWCAALGLPASSDAAP